MHKVSVTILFLILTLIAAFLAQGSGDAPFLKSDPKHVLTYSDGEKPWMTHISTEINTTLEKAISENRYLRSLLCNDCDGRIIMDLSEGSYLRSLLYKGKNLDERKKSFYLEKHICLKGKGAKMVVPLGYPSWSHFVFYSPLEGGFFEQKDNAQNTPNHFYDSSIKFRTKFFLMPFENYEIPTYFPEEVMMFLPLWKQLFLSHNKMDGQYFDKHIRVMGAFVRDSEREGKQRQFFMVEYYYYVDWARIKLRDGFVISYEGNKLADVLDSMELEDSFSAFEKKLVGELVDRVRRNIQTIKLQDHIATKDQISKAVMNTSPLLRFDVNHSIGLSRRGELIMKLWRIEDWDANKCLRASVTLENAKVSEVTRAACWLK